MGSSVHLARVIATVLFAAGPTAASAAASAECPAAVVVHGPTHIQIAISAELVRAGISEAPTPGCTAAHVTITEGTSTLTLEMTDADGRVTRRTVTGLEAACAVIESRAGGELLAPLLPEGEESNDVGAAGVATETERKVPAPAATVSAPVAVVRETRAPDQPASGHGVTLLVATELSVGSDGSGWAGPAISGCVTLGPTCLGTLIRFWHDLDARAESANVIRKRDAAEVAISVDLPFTRHRINFRPGFELGVGWVHMGGFGGHPEMINDNEFDHGELSAGAHLGASFSVSRHWSVDAGLGASLSVFAHQAPFSVQGVMLPGEPLAYGLASIGLRYGVP